MEQHRPYCIQKYQKAAPKWNNRNSVLLPLDFSFVPPLGGLFK